MTHTENDDTLSLGHIFNEQLQRQDGEFIVQTLRERLDHDMQEWFYDRVLRALKIIPETVWTQKDLVACELLGKIEVACFQAFYSAEVARRLNYVPDALCDWFQHWCLNAILGAGANGAIQNRLPLYHDPHKWNSEQILAALLADILPHSEYASMCVSLLAPLLGLSTTATIATVFSDHATAKEATRKHGLLDSELQSHFLLVETGGGTFYAIEHENGLRIRNHTAHGGDLELWPDEQLAFQACQKLGDDYRVARLTYRELAIELPQMAKGGISTVIIRESDSEGRTYPITDYITLTTSAISSASSSRLGTAYEQLFRQCIESSLATRAASPKLDCPTANSGDDTRLTHAARGNVDNNLTNTSTTPTSNNAKTTTVDDSALAEDLLTGRFPPLHPTAILNELAILGFTPQDAVSNPDIIDEAALARKVRQTCDALGIEITPQQSLTLARHMRVGKHHYRNGVPLTELERSIALKLTRLAMQAVCRRTGETFNQQHEKDCERMVRFGEQGLTVGHKIGEATGCFQMLLALAASGISALGLITSLLLV